METQMTEILLIRHGNTDLSTPDCFSNEKNSPDPSLNAKGRDQAERVGMRLAHSGIKRILSSDLKRTVQTAEAIARHTGIGIELVPALREIDMGRINHCPWEVFRQEDPEYHDRWHSHSEDLPYPGGESGGDVQARAMPVIAALAEEGQGPVAVVTHGGVIRALVCAALRIGQEKRFYLGPPENTSITVLRFDPETGRFHVAVMNDSGHLEFDQPTSF